MNFTINPLPPQGLTESTRILKKSAAAHRFLGELKGVVNTIPNQNILINTLVLQEARDSSAIENIITTHDELYKSILFENLISNPAAKEVQRYAKALKEGFNFVKQQKLITQNSILTIHKILEGNDAGYRKLPGTSLVNESTGHVVYSPPQDFETISGLMDNLAAFINDDSLSDFDPLVKMALLHHQFESIHPFYDGNGRVGRILNILYLVQQQLLDLPILYLSRYIIRNKSDYYRLLQSTRENNSWEEWILFMLSGVEVTAQQTIRTVSQIKNLMLEYKVKIRTDLKKIYSQDLINNLFNHPYTKIEFLMRDLDISRKTAVRYLALLVESGLLNKHKIGNSQFFINQPLFDLFRGEKAAGDPATLIKTLQL